MSILKSAKFLSFNAHDLADCGEGIKVLTDQGISIFAALTELERELISEHTKAGLASARARGRKK